MKRLMIAAALLACACSPPAGDAPAQAATEEPALAPVSLPIADRAGNRLEGLTQTGDRWCTSEGAWCAAAGESNVAVARGDQSAGTIAITDLPEDDVWAVWPQIVRLGGADEAALVGVVRTTRQMYSGGGGEASQLVLYEVRGGGAQEVLRMPYGGSAMIRACFDEDDEQQRAGACHDEYTFVTRVSLDERVADGAPRILLETAAGSFPGLLTRGGDSNEARPLTQEDLVWAHSEACSYRRTYTREADGLYLPDRPLPPCADYLEP
jgi:hypothetical protein